MSDAASRGPARSRINAPQLVAALALLGFAGVVIAGSESLSIGTFSAPGPGLMPLMEGSALAIGSAALVVTALRSSGPQVATSEPQPRLVHPLLSAFLLVLFVAAIPVTGFYVASFGFTMLIVGAARRFRWWLTIVLSLALATLLYVVFGLIFAVNLPRGVFL
jgi:putative tricarboxylic transport membrane protein